MRPRRSLRQEHVLRRHRQDENRGNGEGDRTRDRQPLISGRINPTSGQRSHVPSERLPACRARGSPTDASPGRAVSEAASASGGPSPPRSASFVGQGRSASTTGGAGSTTDLRKLGQRDFLHLDAGHGRLAIHRNGLQLLNDIDPLDHASERGVLPVERGRPCGDDEE